MKFKSSALFFLICFQFCFMNPAIAQDFVHPGVFNRESDFARMRQKIAKMEEPWFSAWNNLLNSPEASLNW